MKHNGVTLTVVVAVENGIDVAYVGLTLNSLAFFVLVFISGFVLIVSCQLYRFFVERYSEACCGEGFHDGIRQIECSEEHISSCQKYLCHFSEWPRVFRFQFQRSTVESLFEWCCGELVGLCRAHTDAESRVTCCPIVAQRAVAKHVVPYVVLLFLGFKLVILEVDGYLCLCYCRHFVNANHICAVPLPVFRRYGVGDGPCRKVLHRSVLGHYGCSLCQTEVQCEGCHIGMAPHVERYLRCIVGNVDYRVGEVEEHFLGVVGVYVCLFYVALGIQRLVFETRLERHE